MPSPDRTAGPARPTPIRCVACGYDLAGLPTEGRCPECATPIERTRPTNGLANAPTAYLRTLVLGLRLVLAGTLVAALSLASPMLAIITGSFSPGVSGAIAGAITLGLVLTAPALSLLGWWLLAAPDPGPADDDTPWTGPWTRWSAAVTAGGAVLAQAGGGVWSPAPVAGTLADAVGLAGALAAAAGGLVLIVSAHLHVRWLGLRAPAPAAASMAPRVPALVLAFLLLALVPPRYLVGLWQTLHALGVFVTLISALYCMYRAHTGVAGVLRGHLRRRLAGV